MKKLDFKLILAIAALYLFIEMLGVTCPIKFLTGISCAGCGMSRAMLSLIRLDIRSAFYYHPLFILPFVFLILILFRKKISDKAFNAACGVMAAAFIVVWIYRMIAGGQDIVVFRPSENILSRIINLFN